MNVAFIEALEDGSISNRILEILTQCSGEFVPPLTARNSTTQSDFLNTTDQNGDIPYAYFDTVKRQKLLVAEEGGTVIGFMSYKTDYTNDVIIKEQLPNIYISTVVADKNFRRRGVTKGLYGALCEKYSDKSIFTRTWSTNASHTRLLGEIGFREFKRIPDDRGVGIDTVYYVKEAYPLRQAQP